jgi:hypothetical protein
MTKEYLESVKKRFRTYKELGEKAIAQVSDEQLHYSADPESNSIAVIMQHMHGNMMSRWTDFLTTDGEKQWRERDAEFEEQKLTRDGLLKLWNEGWSCLFKALDGLRADDLVKTVHIRNEPLTAVDAINRQLAHYPYHVGQIVFIAKHLAGAKWNTLSMPKKR